MGVLLDRDNKFGTLWLRRAKGGEPIVMLEVVNSTRGEDGRFKHYWLRVSPTMKTAREAVAWTFGMKADEHEPLIET